MPEGARAKRLRAGILTFTHCLELSVEVVSAEFSTEHVSIELVSIDLVSFELSVDIDQLRIRTATQTLKSKALMPALFYLRKRHYTTANTRDRA